MKKSILIFALLLITAVSFAQPKTDTVKKPPVAVKPKPEFKADPHRKYTIVLEGGKISNLMVTSSFGIVPYLKTTHVEINQLDGINEQFKDIYKDIDAQVKIEAAQDTAQFKADTTAANKKLKPKK